MYSRNLNPIIMRHTYSFFGRFDPPRRSSNRKVESGSLDYEVDSSSSAYVIRVCANGTLEVKSKAEENHFI